MAKNPKEMMVCFPKELLRRDFTEAMDCLTKAVSLLDKLWDQYREKDLAVRDASVDAMNEVDVAREILAPIFASVGVSRPSGPAEPPATSVGMPSGNAPDTVH